jgi:hypothetical protein
MTIPFEKLKARLLANPKVKAEYDVPATISCKIVQWRATVDEDGQYCFAVAL